MLTKIYDGVVIDMATSKIISTGEASWVDSKDVAYTKGGGGDFFVIETERWAFDSVEELVELFNKFKEKHEKIKEEKL